MNTSLVLLYNVICFYIHVVSSLWKTCLLININQCWFFFVFLLFSLFSFFFLLLLSSSLPSLFLSFPFAVICASISEGCSIQPPTHQPTHHTNDTMTNLVNRTLYRALLRATHNGQRPEILSIFGSVHAYINSGISSNLLPAHPNTPNLVRQHLKFTFRYPTPNQAEDIDDDTNELYDGFAALRCANENTKVLYPRLEHTAPLGIFDFSSTFLLPNEEFSFNFFEPRYKTMALDAIEHHWSIFWCGVAPSLNWAAVLLLWLACRRQASTLHKLYMSEYDHVSALGFTAKIMGCIMEKKDFVNKCWSLFLWFNVLANAMSDQNTMRTHTSRLWDHLTLPNVNKIICMHEMIK